jgi:hypothetical protein
MNSWLRIILVVAVTLIGLLGLFVLTLRPCGKLPYVHPLPILSTGPLYVMTDRGRLLPGQTYQYRNEGPWVGSVTLLISWPGKAFVLVRYPEESVRSMCIDSFP